jgi:hypothetical protein
LPEKAFKLIIALKITQKYRPQAISQCTNTTGGSKMNPDDFKRLLDESTQKCVEFARRYVVDDLEGQIIYQLLPNKSCDWNPQGDEVVFPEDSLSCQDDFHLMTADEVVHFLWRDSRVPVWIDISVVACSEGQIVIELLCAGRYSGEWDRYYYTDRGTGPFGVKSPAFAPRYDFELSGRFHVFDPKARRKKISQQGAP